MEEGWSFVALRNFQQLECQVELTKQKGSIRAAVVSEREREREYNADQKCAI